MRHTPPLATLPVRTGVSPGDALRRRPGSIGVILIALALLGLAACGRDEATSPQDGRAEGGRAGTRTSRDAGAVRDADQPPEPEPVVWTPRLTDVPEDRIEATLRRADAARKAGRLEGGAEAALDLYLSVQRAEADNARAAEGIEAVVDALAERGDKAIAEGQLDQAARTAAVLRAVRADAEATREFEGRVRRARAVAHRLARGDRQLRAGRLIAPPGDNALETYRAVLSEDDGNVGALSGLESIERKLIAQAEAATARGEDAQAERALADAARVRPGSRAVQDAGARIVVARQRLADSLYTRALAEIEADRLDAAEKLAAAHARASTRTRDVEVLRGRIALAHRYGRFRPAQDFREPLSAGGQGPEMRVLPHGEFRMGSDDDEPGHRKDEGPQHAVRFPRGLAMSRAEITVAEFRRFSEATGYIGSAQQHGESMVYDEKGGNLSERDGVDYRHDYAGERADADLPVLHVSWRDASAYAAWLSQQTGASYRLPTEAEFEYALRAGGDDAYPWGSVNPTRVVGNLTGDGDRSPTRREWSNAFPDYKDGYWGPAPVRKYPRNAFGLYDMVGNVLEWVQDCWHDSYRRAPGDGSAWVNPGCGKRVVRGASWASSPDQARSAWRLGVDTDTTSARVGFRVVRDL